MQELSQSGNAGDCQSAKTAAYATPDDPDNWIKLGAFGHYFIKA